MSMKLVHNKVGQSTLALSSLGLGGTGLANMYTPISDSEASATIRAAINGGISFFDTAPCYGMGLSETRFGKVLPTLPRDSFVISTKVGYMLDPLPNGTVAEPTIWADPPPFTSHFDFSYDAAMRSIEGSLQRLGLDRLDMVAIHDPDETAGADPLAPDPYSASHFDEAMNGAYKALHELRAQGVIRAIGVGMNQWQMLADFARAGEFDFLLCAGRYNLLFWDAWAEFMPLCAQKGISVIIGGPYASGILGSGAKEGATYFYQPAPPEVLERVRLIENLCAEFNISLRAAALRFALRHPAVASVIPGARSSQEVEENIAAMAETVPDNFWAALGERNLIDPAVLAAQTII